MGVSHFHTPKPQTHISPKGAHLQQGYFRVTWQNKLGHRCSLGQPKDFNTLDSVQEVKAWTKLLQRFVLLHWFYNIKFHNLGWEMSKLREQMRRLSESPLTLHKLILTAKLFGFQNSSVRLQHHWTLYSMHSLHNTEQQCCLFSASSIVMLLNLGVGVHGVNNALQATFGT